ncbi:MFS transporter [Bacillus carboniphilus]|uniref:MFS transporter n=1 Tax=Bacillus carboniphilus TaxID=86663 RepID=A0ABN0W0C9_9BACI
MRSYIGIFKNPNYVKLFIAQFASQIGTVTGLIAFTFYILDRFSQQPVFATLTEMMYSLPTLFLFFLTGVLADSFDRQKIARNCDWICAGLSLLLLGAVMIGFMPLIFALLFIRSGISKFFPPAQSALLQGVLTKEDYPTAMGLNSMLSSVFFLTGSGLGAFIYWNLGVEGAILIDALSFLVSGVFIALCRIPLEVRMPNGQIAFKEFKLKTVFQNFWVGVKYAWGKPIVLTLLIGILMIGVLNGGTAVMHIFIMKYKLAPETYEQVQIGLTIAIGLGVLSGSIIATYLSKKVALYKMIIASFLINGITPFIQSSIEEIWVYFIVHFIFGTAIPLCNVAFFGWLGQIVDPKMMGRVQGLVTPLMMFTLTLTQAFIAAAFPNHMTIEGIFYIVGGASLATALFYLIKLPKLAKIEHEKSGIGRVVKATM